MSKFHTRCRNCTHRRKLAMHPDEYRIQPKCQCGARSWRVDLYRQSGLDKRPVCRSDCAHYFHRMGCGLCKFNADGTYKEFA